MPENKRPGAPEPTSRVPPDMTGAHTSTPPDPWHREAFSSVRDDSVAGAPPPLDPTGADAGTWRPPADVWTASRPVRRVNVNFSEQAYETLEDLARHSGKTMSEVLREAIALKAWFDRERIAGNRILVERPNGQIREVISV